MERLIFQSSDLVKNRVKLLETARAGRALVRDKDGAGLVMLPEQELDVLEQYALWSQVHLRLTSISESQQKITVSSLGDLAWLRVFDREDIAEFAAELHDALIAGLSDRRVEPVQEVVKAWRVTASQLEAPLRKSVLLERMKLADFDDAEEPREEE